MHCAAVIWNEMRRKCVAFQLFVAMVGGMGLSMHFLFQKSFCKTGSSISEGFLPGVCSKILSSFKTVVKSNLTPAMSFGTTDLLDWLYVNLKSQIISNDAFLAYNFSLAIDPYCFAS